MLNKNERKGKVDQVKGHVKQAIGAVTGDESMKAEGKVDVAIGAVEESVGHVTRKTTEAFAAATKTVKH